MPKSLGDRPLLWILLAVGVALSPIAFIAFCMIVDGACYSLGGQELGILLSIVVVPVLVIVAAFVAFVIWRKSWLGRLLQVGTMLVLVLGLVLIGGCVAAAGFPGEGVVALVVWVAVLAGVVVLIRLLKARG